MSEVINYPFRIDRQLWQVISRRARKNERTVAGEMRHLLRLGLEAQGFQSQAAQAKSQVQQTAQS